MPNKISLQSTLLLTGAACSAWIQIVYLIKGFSEVKELSHSHIHSIHTKTDNYLSPSKPVLFLPTWHLPATSTIQRKTFIVTCLCQTKVQKMVPNSFLSSQCANIIMRLESCKQTWQKHTFSLQMSADLQRHITVQTIRILMDSSDFRHY